MCKHKMERKILKFHGMRVYRQRSRHTCQASCILYISQALAECVLERDCTSACIGSLERSTAPTLLDLILCESYYMWVAAKISQSTFQRCELFFLRIISHSLTVSRSHNSGISLSTRCWQGALNSANK